MMRQIMGVVTICGLLVAGCNTPQMKQNAPVQKTESEVLQTAFAETLADVVSQMKKDKGEFSPEATKPEFVVRSMEMMKDKFPSLFLVTPVEEASFKAGRFEDDLNRKRVEQSIDQLAEYEVALPKMCLVLINKHRSGKLEGSQLELAARLLSAQVDEVRAMVENLNAEQERIDVLE